MAVNGYSYARFSSSSQEEGDSLRRQGHGENPEESPVYKKCREVGLKLIPLRADKAKSAYKGEHLKNGELGLFLKLVEDGTIPKGSWLLIENIDRISRLPPMDAQELMIRIIRSGLTLWVAQSNLTLNEEILDRQPFLQYQLLGELIRAYSESKYKSDRVKQEYGKRLNDIRKGKPQHGKCPSWLQFNGNGWDLIPEHAQTVRIVVDMTLNGIGCVAICRKLNELNRPLFRESKNKKAKAWQVSTVRYLQLSRTLIGEYQPKQKEGNSYQPHGKPVEGYYPPVIDQKTFNRMQAVLGQRLIGGKTRDSEGILNLFGRILVDGFDGSTIRLSQSEKGGRTSMRSSLIRSGAAKGVGFNYNEFERNFLNWVTEIKLNPSKKGSDLSALMDKLTAVQVDIGNMKAKFKTAKDRGMVADLVHQLREEEEQLIEQINHERLKDEHRIESTASLIRQLADCPAKHLKEFRAQIRVQIQITCQRIAVYCFRQRMKLACAAHVILADGSDHLFWTVTERNKPTITARMSRREKGNSVSWNQAELLELLPEIAKNIFNSARITEVTKSEVLKSLSGRKSKLTEVRIVSVG